MPDVICRPYITHEPLPHKSVEEITLSGRPAVAYFGGGGNAPGIKAAMVTAVNALLASGYDVYGLFGSWGSLKKGHVPQIIDFRHIPPDAMDRLVHQGGTELHTGRDVLTTHEFINVFAIRNKLKLICAGGMGGDGTLEASKSLQYTLGPDGEPTMNVVLGTKTVDNDLARHQNATGFLTSVIKSAEAIECGLNMAYGFSGTTVVEIYGRDNGHLTLYSAGMFDPTFPIITLIPECPITREEFLARHSALKKPHGGVCVAVAEGFCFQGEAPSIIPGGSADGMGHQQLNSQELIKNVLIKAGVPDVKGYKPSWVTRECPPIIQDIKLGQAMGRGVATLIKEKAYGTIIAAQGSFKDGFQLVPLPLWPVATGNPVPLSQYDRVRLAPDEDFRLSFVNNLDPQIHELDITNLPRLKQDHADLMQRIHRGTMVDRSGIRIPEWAIRPDIAGHEQTTIWKRPIERLL